MTMSPQDALARLREGNARFASGASAGHFDAAGRAGLMDGQEPWAAIVGCSDSRVPVEAVFDVGPGELFVVRTAGHVLAQASLASVRYAVETLGVCTVIVLGHEDCGAVTAALEGNAPAWLDPIVRHIRIHDIDPASAPDDADDALLAAAVDEHVRDTVIELREFFARADLPGEVPLVAGAAFKLASGEVHWLHAGERVLPK